MNRPGRPPEGELTRTALRSIFLFEDFDNEQLELLRDSTRVTSLQAGDRLFGFGEAATHVHWVKNGQVKLFRTSRTGDEKIVALVRSQEMFAEAVLFADDMPGYPVSASALDESEVWSFDVTHVRSVIGASTQSCFRLLRRLSVRLHEMVNEIDQLTLHNATFRTVNFLLQSLPSDVMRSRDIQLTMPKVAIASRLSVKPETLSRVLHRLVERELLEVHGSNIVIRDVERLQRMLDE